METRTNEIHSLACQTAPLAKRNSQLSDTYNFDRRPPCCPAGHPTANGYSNVGVEACCGVAMKTVQQSMAEVVVVDLGEWRERYFGRAG
ncbi:hypothetical protein [Xanthomonas campestris]|uniref:hypothetical protein n=1 Tax=Xanthomonas campestris TaxID=339 RepID=UPI0032E46D59